jgi:hypothetical protein
MVTEYETDRHGNRRKCCIPCKDKRESKKATNEDENNQKKRYYECKGLICGHNKNKYRCRECKGSSICEHDKQRTSCIECKGSGICEHNRRRAECRDCKGSSRCVHEMIRRQCSQCDPGGHLQKSNSLLVNKAIRNKNFKDVYNEILGCTLKEFKEHIEKQFKEGMTWDNHGEWHIDHIKAVKSKNSDGNPPTLEEVRERLHYTNCQPLTAQENLRKYTK